MKRSTGTGIALALFLVLGVVTTALGVGMVESRLAEAAQDRLGAAGFDGVTINMDGRDATLAGFATPADAAAGQELVKSTRGVRVADLADGAITGEVDSNDADTDADDGADTEAADDADDAPADEEATASTDDESGEAEEDTGDATDADDDAEEEAEAEDESAADEDDGGFDEAAADLELQNQLDALMNATRVDGEQFASLSTDLSPAMTNTLDIAAELLNERPELRLEVAGHTDFHGSNDANQALSQGRAQAVAGYLIEQGVSSDRIDAVGYGEANPIADNNFYDGQQKNRRVELNLLEATQ